METGCEEGIGVGVLGGAVEDVGEGFEDGLEYRDGSVVECVGHVWLEREV